MSTPKKRPTKIKGKTAQKRVSAKISHLRKTEPGMAPKQAVATALSMERAHRLGPGGAYKPVAKKKTTRKK